MICETVKFNWNSVSDYRDQDNPKRRGWLVPKHDYDLLKSNACSGETIAINIDEIGYQDIILGEYTPNKRRLKIKESYQLRKTSYSEPTVLTVVREPILKCGYVPVGFKLDDKKYRLVNMNIFVNV